MTKCNPLQFKTKITPRIKHILSRLQKANS